MKNPTILKNIQQIGIWVLLIIFTTACGKIPNTEQGNGAITISFSASPELQSQYDPLIAAFEAEYPDIQIQFIPLEVDPSNMNGYAFLADTVALPALPVGEDATTYLDLQPLMEVSNNFSESDYLPGVFEGCQVDGAQIGLPYAVSFQVVYYNPEAFDEVGQDIPQPDWTWNDFHLNAIRLTAKTGDAIDRYGFYNPSGVLHLLGAPINQALMMADDAQKVDALENILNPYLRLVQQGAVGLFEEGALYADYQSVIREGRAAMWLDSLFQLDTYREMVEEQVSFLPTPESGRAGAYCLAISAGTEQPQAAWHWIQFLSVQGGPFSMPYQLPAYQEGLQNDQTWNSFTDQEQANLQMLLDHAWYGSHWLFRSFSEQFGNVIAGQTDLNTMLFDVLAYSQPPTPEPVQPNFSIPAYTPPDDVPPGATLIKFQSGYLGRVNLSAIADEFNHAQQKYYIDLNIFNEEADCFVGSSYQLVNEAEVFYPLDSLIEADVESISLVADIPAGVLNSTRHRGEILGIPLVALTNVIYYDPALLEQAGLEPPAPDWTIDEFWTYARAATQEEVYGFGLGSGAINMIYETRNSPFFDEGGGTLTFLFDTQAVKQTTAFLLEMKQDGVIPQIDISLGDNYLIWQENILTRKAAFWMGGVDGHMNQELDYEPGVLPLPGYQSAASLIGLPSFFISKNTDNAHGCWAWFKHFSSNPGAYPGIPLRNSILYSPEYETQIGEPLATAYQMTVEQMGSTSFNENERYTVFYKLGPSEFFITMLGNLEYGDNLDAALQKVQFQSESYLICLQNFGGKSEDHYQECMDLVD